MSRASEALYARVGSIDSDNSHHIVIVRALWNSEITQHMFNTCKSTLLDHGISESQIAILEVPGSYELVYGAMHALNVKKADVAICLGCIIKGETQHDEFIAHAVAQGLQQLMLETNKPCVFGVLTTNTKQQAIDRSNGTHGDKGKESAITALELLRLGASS